MQTSVSKTLKIITAVIFVFVAFAILYCVIERVFLYPRKYVAETERYCTLYNVQIPLVLSVCNTESGFNKNAVSNKSAKGIMQLTDITAKYVADMLGEKEYDIFDPETNIRFGTYYLAYLSDKFVNTATAVCAYNAGESRVKAWLSFPEYSDDGITLKRIPYDETEKYCKRVIHGVKKYSQLYGY